MDGRAKLYLCPVDGERRDPLRKAQEGPSQPSSRLECLLRFGGPIMADSWLSKHLSHRRSSKRMLPPRRFSESGFGH